MTGMCNTTGAMLPLREHIRQSIADILTTPIGQRLMRRDYGSYLPQLVDHPATEANRLRLIAATAQAIMKWEPRTRLQSVGVTFNARGRCQLAIVRRDVGGEDTPRSTLELGGASAGA